MRQGTVSELVGQELEDEKEVMALDDNDEAPCLLMSHLHYVVMGCIGVKKKISVPTPVLVDTGSVNNVIRRNALPQDWK